MITKDELRLLQNTARTLVRKFVIVYVTEQAEAMHVHGLGDTDTVYLEPTVTSMSTYVKKEAPRWLSALCTGVDARVPMIGGRTIAEPRDLEASIRQLCVKLVMCRLVANYGSQLELPF